MLAWIKNTVRNTLVKFSGWAAKGAKALEPPAPAAAGASFADRMSKKKQIWFVTDIPLFIDDVAVRQLYDAVHRPEFENVSRSQSDSWSKGTQTSDEATLGAEVGFAPILKGAGSAKSSKSHSSGKAGATALEQEANRSAEMRLEQILKFYYTNYPHRVLWTSVNSLSLEDLSGTSLEWVKINAVFGKAEPRPLIVLDLLPKSKLLPMMSETVDGKLQQLYKDFRRSVKDGDLLPAYPGDREIGGGELVAEYWRKLDDAFESSVAMSVVEGSTSKGSRIDWIDYRLIGRLSNDEILPIHLHLCPRGRYSTGTFAYQTIRRGYKYGLRMVGTLKKGEDINVLAIYEV